MSKFQFFPVFLREMVLEVAVELLNVSDCVHPAFSDFELVFQIIKITQNRNDPNLFGVCQRFYLAFPVIVLADQRFNAG